MVSARNRSGSSPSRSASLSPPASSQRLSCGPSTSGWNWNARCLPSGTPAPRRCCGPARPPPRAAGNDRRGIPARARPGSAHYLPIRPRPSRFPYGPWPRPARPHGAERLSAEADAEHRHGSGVRRAQPGQFLGDPGVGIVDRTDRAEHHHMVDAVERGQRAVVGKQVDGQRRAARLERVADEAGESTPWCLITTTRLTLSLRASLSTCLCCRPVHEAPKCRSRLGAAGDLIVGSANFRLLATCHFAGLPGRPA